MKKTIVSINTILFKSLMVYEGFLSIKFLRRQESPTEKDNHVN